MRPRKNPVRRDADTEASGHMVVISPVAPPTRRHLARRRRPNGKSVRWPANALDEAIILHSSQGAQSP